MAGFSSLPLQQALYQKLTGDVTLMALVKGVYDRPPQGSDYPYVTLGEFSTGDWSTKTTTGSEQRFSVHAWSREGGRKEAETVMERIHTLLHDGTLTVSGQALVMMRFLSASVSQESDGWTYHGMMSFRALLEAA